MKPHLGLMITFILMTSTVVRASDNFFRMACQLSSGLFPDGRLIQIRNAPPLTMIIEQEYTDRTHNGRRVDGELLLDHVLVRNMNIDTQGIDTTVRITFDNDLSQEIWMHGRSEAERSRIVDTILNRSRALEFDRSSGRGSVLAEGNFGPRSIPIPALNLGSGARRASSSFHLDGSILFSVRLPNPRPGGLDLAYNYQCYPPQAIQITPPAAPTADGKGTSTTTTAPEAQN